MLLFYSFLIICKMVRFHADTYLISLCRVRICYRTLCHFWHVYEKPLRCVLLRISRRRAPAESLLSDHSAGEIILLVSLGFPCLSEGV